MADLEDVKAKEQENSDLWARMDDDRDLYDLSPFVLKDKDNQKVSGIINVTLNIPATFAAHVQSALMAATQQARVTGKDLNDEFTHNVEQFLTAFFKAADRRLMMRQEPALRPFFTEQFTIRGRAGARITLRRSDKGDVIPDILPIDTRYFTYSMGVDGMEWGAYTTYRTEADVKAEYPEAKLPPRTKSTELIPVVDVWDKESNSIYAAEALVYQQSNPYGKPPFTLQLVPLGSMLKDKESKKRWGESIFFLIRDLVPELNRLASLLQTSNQAAVLAALTWHSKEGTQATPPENLGEMGVTTAADIGGGASIVPVGDIKAAGRLVHSMFTRMIQIGSLSTTDYGNAPFPMSAVALVELGESSNQVFMPRLGANGLLYQQNAYMILEQVQALGMSDAVFGDPGRKQTFSVADLKGDYNIEYQYFIKSPQTDVARYAIADVAKQFLDDDTVLRDIVQVENPSAIIEAKRYDEAEDLSPGVKLYRTAEALIKQGKTVQAKIIADQLGITLDQLVSGELAPPAKRRGNGQQPASNILPPLVPGTRSASNKRASQLQGEAGQAANLEEE